MNLLTPLYAIFPCGIVTMIIFSISEKGREKLVKFNNYVEKRPLLNILLVILFYGSLLMCMYNSLGNW